jgi:hypothetical protein
MAPPNSGQHASAGMPQRHESALARADKGRGHLVAAVANGAASAADSGRHRPAAAELEPRSWRSLDASGRSAHCYGSEGPSVPAACPIGRRSAVNRGHSQICPSGPYLHRASPGDDANDLCKQGIRCYSADDSLPPVERTKVAARRPDKDAVTREPRTVGCFQIPPGHPRRQSHKVLPPAGGQPLVRRTPVQSRREGQRVGLRQCAERSGLTRRGTACNARPDPLC